MVLRTKRRVIVRRVKLERSAWFVVAMSMFGLPIRLSRFTLTVFGFADGHTAYFKYSHICVNTGIRPTDPGIPDINWTFNGHAVPH
jgi:hypothetical protein